MPELSVSSNESYAERLTRNWEDHTSLLTGQRESSSVDILANELGLVVPL